jgi:hypothetical protein
MMVSERLHQSSELNDLADRCAQGEIRGSGFGSDALGEIGASGQIVGGSLGQLTGNASEQVTGPDSAVRGIVNLIGFGFKCTEDNRILLGRVAAQIFKYPFDLTEISGRCSSNQGSAGIGFDESALYESRTS